MKKVLILSYYWPPAGGGGVQRWLKFSKYMHEFGWEPIIYTAENGETAAYDESLMQEVRSEIQVLRTPIWEPYQFYKKFIGKKKEDKVYSGFISEGKDKSWAQHLSIFIRGNFFIPDARCFWIKPSIKYLNNFLNNNKIDAIISTGPPHSMHRIAYGLKQSNQSIPWIADFRDPWTHIDFYNQLHLTWIADFVHKRLEKQVLKKADKVVTVSPSWAEDFERISQRKDIQVITNGFDPEDFENRKSKMDSVFTITHIGSMNEDRNPKVLWNALKIIKKRGLNFKVKLIGQVDHSVTKSIMASDLEQQVEYIKFMPHKEVVVEMMQSNLLLLPINDTPNQKGVLPGKLYEYIGARIPILCIGKSNGDAANILQSFSQAKVCDYEDVVLCTSIIESLYYKKEEIIISNEADKYSRKTLAAKYCALLESL